MFYKVWALHSKKKTKNKTKTTPIGYQHSLGHCPLKHAVFQAHTIQLYPISPQKQLQSQWVPPHLTKTWAHVKVFIPNLRSWVTSMSFWMTLRQPALLNVLIVTCTLLQPVTLTASQNSITSVLVPFVIFSNQHPPFFQLSQLYISTISVQQPHGDFESPKSTCIWFYFFSFFILDIIVDHFKHSLVNTHCSPEFLPSLHILLQNFNPRTMHSFYFCSVSRLLSSGKIHVTLQNGAGTKSWFPTSCEPPHCSVTLPRLLLQTLFLPIQY